MRRALIAATVLATAFPVLVFGAVPLSTDKAVCWIRAGDGGGSGTLIGWTADKRKALVLSCHHLCGDVGNMVVCSFRNEPAAKGKEFNGRVIRSSRQYDLAAVLIPNPGIPPVGISDFGYYRGTYSACGYGEGKYRSANGKLIGVGPTLFQTSTPIYGGFSGGVLLDPGGALCGVTNWGDGDAVARSGEPLRAFIKQSTKECAVFTRWRNRRNGGNFDTCQPGEDCYTGASPGSIGTIGPVPGYTNLTPVSPPAQVPAQVQYAAPSQPPVLIAANAGVPMAPAPIVVRAAQQVDPYNPAAPPVAVAVSAAPIVAQPIVQPMPPATVAAAPVASADAAPLFDFSRRMQAAIELQREQKAINAALEAYQAEREGVAQTEPSRPPRTMIADSRSDARIEAIEQKLGMADAEAVRDDPSVMINRLPVVEMTVTYPEGKKESAVIDLAKNVRRLLTGATGETPEED